MPPKSSASGKEKSLIGEEEVLQAVILADSFNKRFSPLTLHKPRCLLPICNAPLLDWTFESLALAGVQEIFVICRSHAELVKAAIKNSKWSKPSAGLKIVPIMTARETFSPGDAMRDIYTHGIITSDFVLVTGDLVSSVRIDEVVRVHKERRRTNKDAIMTMVVKESGVRHRTRSRGESAVFVVDPKTSECLYYEAVTGYPPKKYASVPREVLKEHPEVEIRNDLIDCAIDVCSVEDNFDYGDIRRDFVHGVLTSDLLMKNIYCYIASDGYAARVKDTKSYDAISKDILARWTFPLVPDDNHPGGHSYEHIRGNKYIAKDNTVTLSRTCKIGNNTLIGSHCQISDNAHVSASVLGQRCTIGAGSVVQNSYLFDGVVIGPNCTIEYSILSAGVTIKDGSRVERGCLVGDGVVVGPGARLLPFDRLSRRLQDVEESDRDEDSEACEGESESEANDDEEDEDGEEEEEEDSGDDEKEVDSDYEEVDANQDPEALKRLGPDTNAIIWPEPSYDEDEVDEVEHPINQRLMRIGDVASDLDLSDAGSETSESESDDNDDDDDHFGGSDLSSSVTSLPLTGTSNLVQQADEAAFSEFQHEVKLSLERAFAENHSVDNAAVELKTLRMAHNVPLRRVREAVVSSIVNRIKIVEGGGALQRQEINAVVSRWGELIDKIGGVDAVETIEVLQECCASSDRLPLFGQTLAALYQEDIVEEDDIRSWHRKSTSRGDDQKTTGLQENFKKCWNVGAHMIKQFDEQESEESEEEAPMQGRPVPTTSRSPAPEEESSEEEEEASGEEEDDDEESGEGTEEESE